jgi:hypothetical protein
VIIVGSYVFKVQLLPLLDDQGAAQRLKRAKRSKVPNLPTPRRHRYDLPLCVCSSTRGCMCRSVCLICCSGSLNIDRVVLSTLLMTRKMSRKGVLLYVYWIRQFNLQFECQGTWHTSFALRHADSHLNPFLEGRWGNRQFKHFISVSFPAFPPSMPSLGASHLMSGLLTQTTWACHDRAQRYSRTLSPIFIPEFLVVLTFTENG